MDQTTKQQKYQINIQGHLTDAWSEWFDNLSLTLRPDGVTVITATFADQAALFGLLWRIRDLGLPLLSIQTVNKEKNHE